MRSTAAAAATCALLAGCGQATLTTAPVGPPHASSTRHAPSAGANRQAARREAARLVTLANVPPGSVDITTRPLGLQEPAMGMTAASSAVDRSRLWRVSLGLDATLAWVRAHPPRGLVAFGSTSGGGGPGYRMVGIGYSEPDRPGVQNLALVIGLATVRGGTAIRADGMAMWLDPRPLRDDRTGTRLGVTLADGCPRRDNGAVSVRPPAPDSHDLDARLLPAASPTEGLICDYSGISVRPAGHLLRSRRLDAAVARRLAQAVGRLPLGHPVGEVTPCPMADRTASVLAFSYDGRADVDLWMDRNGCAYVTNGRIMTRVGDLTAAVATAERAAG